MPWSATRSRRNVQRAARTFVGEVEEHTSDLKFGARSLLWGKKPLRQPNRDMRTWAIAVLLCSQQKGPQPCFDNRKNALCAITITRPFCGGLPTGPRPKRPALDCVLSATKPT